jgi:hypothetical protein
MPFPFIYFFLCVLFFVGAMMSWKVLINSGQYVSGVLGLIVSITLLVLTGNYLVRGFHELKEFRNLKIEDIRMMKLQTTDLDSSHAVTLDTAEINSVMMSILNRHFGIQNHPIIQWRVTAQIYLPREHTLNIDIYTTTNNGTWAELKRGELRCDETKEIIEKICPWLVSPPTN